MATTYAPKSPLLIVDSLDTRKEVWNLLKRLSPKRRIDFLSWCCQRAKLKKGRSRPFVARRTRELAALARWDSGADERLHHEVWGDLWQLVQFCGVDPAAACEQLARMVRER